MNYDRDFQFYCNETGTMYEKVAFAGIKIPIGKKDHIQAFKNFASKKLFQRDVEFVVKQVEGNNIWVSDANLSSEDSPLRQMLLKGFAKLENDANTKLESLEYLGYKALQD